MILEQALLRNFGVYRGEQSIDLRPVSPSGKARPIILFGGLNGGGKTTLLDAILLALYGPRARCSKRGQLAYEDFLRQSIHRAAPTVESACVAVTFRYGAEGAESTYEVHREWWRTDDRIKEKLEVFRNGALDRMRTENWSQLVEELIPSGLSQLYFFDGDRIRSLAEDETYSDVLGSAIKSLLGLDVVERLITDCDVLERRQRRSDMSEEERRRFDELQQGVNECEQLLSDTRASLASERNTLLRAESSLRACEEDLALRGSKLGERRESLRIREGELRSKQEALSIELRNLVDGPLPLCLLSDLLREAHLAHAGLISSRDAGVVARILDERDRAIVESFARKCEQREPVRVLEMILQDDRHVRSVPASAGNHSELSDRAAVRLGVLLDGELDRLRERTCSLVGEIGSLTTELEDIARSLAIVPDEEGLARFTARLTEENRKYAASKERVAALESKASELNRELEAKRAQLNRLLERQLSARADEEDALRKQALVKRTSTSMRQFLEVSTARKIGRLAELITESFQFLLHKTALIDRVSIDPASFNIELIGRDGQTLSRNRLSEGEKQLFAVSVLWGLAKASGRPLPVIIDTPMARLDSEHRTHVVERYLTHASHQVIVLSTDTEIDKEHYESLRGYLAKSYRLDFREKEQVTVVREGYFWD